MTEQQTKVQPGSNPKSKVLKKFLELYPRFAEFQFEDGHFTDHQVQELYMVFLAGWQSHPSHSAHSVSIIGELSETGVKFSSEPRLHIKQGRVYREKARLEEKYKGKKFVVFTCHDVENVLYPKALESYQRIMEDLAPAIAERKNSLNFNAIKERFFKLSENYQAFVMVPWSGIYNKNNGKPRDLQVRRLKHIRHQHQLTSLIKRIELAETNPAALDPSAPIYNAVLHPNSER